MPWAFWQAGSGAGDLGPRAPDRRRIRLSGRSERQGATAALNSQRYLCVVDLLRNNTMLNVHSILTALAPTPDGPQHDQFANRWTKCLACLCASVLSAALLAGAVSLLEHRDGNGTMIEWAGPAFFAILTWLSAGQAWLYWTLRLAPWSAQYLQVWWRVTGGQGPNKKP